MSSFMARFDHFNTMNAVSIDWLFSVHPCLMRNTKTGRGTWSSLLIEMWNYYNLCFWKGQNLCCELVVWRNLFARRQFVLFVLFIYLHDLLFVHQCENKCVAQVACDMLLLLCDHAERLRRPLPEVPKRIIEVSNYSWTILKGKISWESNFEVSQIP